MSEGLRVLVIDDDDAVREVACRGLEAEGYRVAAAASGPAGLALVTAEPFDAIVSDIRMPGLSGLELLAEIRRTQPDAVVVLMTGYADFEMVLTALRAGADDFVVKPVNFRALAAVVRRAIDRRELRADLAALRRQAHLTDRFLAFVSHKLNTPLTGLLLFLEALADEGGVERRLALLDAGLPDALAAAGRLRDLIDALLRFAQAAAAAPPAGGAGGGVPLLPLLEEVAAVGGRAAPR
ncbi:MAG TPA: response regulator, partial [Thermodesulfobacteriota bacterium]|nr:response regulator [Thermodesulfobacteriota bacterium]